MENVMLCGGIFPDLLCVVSSSQAMLVLGY